jgi:hypothetical protein
MADRDVIMERVRRLLALRDDAGATPGESAAAAKMAAGLMARFQLDEAMVRGVKTDAAGRAEVHVEEADVARADWVPPGGRIVGWVQDLVSAAASAAGARAIFYRRTDVRVAFVGAWSDATVARETLVWLIGRVERDWQRYRRENAPERVRAAGASFRNGWATGVRQAVDAEVAERQRDTAASAPAPVPAAPSSGPAAGAPSGGALVVRMEQVTRAKALAMRNWIATNIGRLGRARPRSYSVGDAAAYGAGHSRGRSTSVGDGRANVTGRTGLFD